MSINEGVFKFSAGKLCVQPLPTFKDDHPQLKSLEQELSISMHGVLKDCEVVGLLKVELLNVQDLSQIDPLKLPQSNVILGVVTITCTITNVTLAWFFHILKL